MKVWLVSNRDLLFWLFSFFFFRVIVFRFFYRLFSFVGLVYWFRGELIGLEWIIGFGFKLISILFSFGYMIGLGIGLKIMRCNEILFGNVKLKILFFFCCIGN